jgi:RimJ/RimL family protein N-acetyltransferase
LEVRFAEDADLPYLLRQNDEVFEPKHLLGSFIKNKGISLFEKDKIIAGCGFLTQIHSKYNYYDIGVWVNPEFRNRGYATQIVSYLKDYCLKNNVLPVCGCSAENIASQKTLAKAGFISTHELIEFTIAAK